MPDHLHILVELKPDISVSDFVQVVKQSSSRMLKNNPNFPSFRGWQKSFGSFSYCKSELETVKRYIMSQKKHHKQKTFIEEMKNLFDENRILYDEFIENNI
jgi:REP element-mobilizing transposase RayT